MYVLALGPAYLISDDQKTPEGNTNEDFDTESGVCTTGKPGFDLTDLNSMLQQYTKSKAR